MASVSEAVEADLGRLGAAAQESWEAELARTLAAAVDEEPNASMARELRAVMKDLSAGLASAGAKVSKSDDLAARRADRIAKATGS